MGSVSVFNLQEFISEHGCEIYLETGTGLCDCFTHASKYPFTELYSIDIDGELIDRARTLFNQPNMHFIHNYSHIALDDLLSTIPKDKSVLFFLDAHFPGADFHKISYEESITQFKEDAFPLIKEINIIKKHRDISKDVFIMDDWFLYQPELDYVASNTKNWPYTELQKSLGVVKDGDADYITNNFIETHNKTISNLDQGYLILTPKNI
jgi:hypothetical protein